MFLILNIPTLNVTASYGNFGEGYKEIVKRCKGYAVTATVVFLFLVTFIQAIISFLISGQIRSWTTLKHQEGLR